jgi:hypothetical protein
MIERDIQAVYRFYKLQSSTAAVPSKPTSISTLPPSGWSDTEPTYIEGSTNSLYTVDLTVFTDGTFSYTGVSLSSSYEAAKIAYNQAVTAKSTADGKNTVFYQTSSPATSGRTVGDVWFDTDDDNKMYYWNGSAWTAKQFGADALAANSVTADKILARAITAAKIATNTITANEIASNTITANEINVQDLFAQDITATGSITGMGIYCNRGSIGDWNISQGSLVATRMYDSPTGKATAGTVKVSPPIAMTSNGTVNYEKVGTADGTISMSMRWTTGGSKQATLSASHYPCGYSYWWREGDGSASTGSGTLNASTAITLGNNSATGTIYAEVTFTDTTASAANIYSWKYVSCSISGATIYDVRCSQNIAPNSWEPRIENVPNNAVFSASVTDEELGDARWYVDSNGNMMSGYVKAKGYLPFENGSPQYLFDYDNAFPPPYGGFNVRTVASSATNAPRSTTKSGHVICVGEPSTYMQIACVRDNDAASGASIYVRSNRQSYGFSDWSKIDNNHPIGSVYITSTNTSPASYLGGTWTLITKEFTNTEVSNAVTWNATNVVSGSGAAVFLMRGNRITFRIRFTNKVAITSSTLAIGTINVSKLGITGIYYEQFLGGDDTANASVLFDINTSNGVASLRSLANIGGTISASTATSPTITACGELLFNQSAMVDSACDKFYWKRTA